MAKHQQRILFVSHKADRTGAPIIFLGIITEFKKKSAIPISILIGKDGELTNEFISLGRTYTWLSEELNPGRRMPFVIKILWLAYKRIQHKLKQSWILFMLRKTSIVVYNTIALGYLQEKLHFLKSKSICYVHELPVSIHYTTTPRTLKTILTNTDFFMAGSKAVKDNLVSAHQVNSDCIEIVYSSVPEVFRDKKMYAKTVHQLREDHSIPKDAIIFGVAAVNEWRKGFDLFLPLVTIYFNLYPASKAFFIWKGFRDTPSSFPDQQDYLKYGIRNKVLLMPHGDDVLAVMSCYDVHLCISREDPYPVVVLEAASFGIPTICFADAGGVPEFVEHDCGFCVPYGDLICMAQRLYQLESDAELRIKMGLAAQEKVAKRHSQEAATTQLMNIINHLAG